MVAHTEYREGDCHHFFRTKQEEGLDTEGSVTRRHESYAACIP